VSVSVGHL